MEESPSLIVRWLAAGDEGDVEAFDDLLHGDVIVQAPRGLSTDNLESEKQVWRDAVAAMPDLHHQVQEVVIQGNVEMARVVVTGTLRHSFAGVAGTRRSFRMDQAVTAMSAAARSAKRGRSRTSVPCRPGGFLTDLVANAAVEASSTPVKPPSPP